MAHRPFSRRQVLQNDAFLAALRATGNPRLASSLLGVHRSTYMKRRAKSALFAQAWDAEIAACHADLHASGGPRPPERSSTRFRGQGDHSSDQAAMSPGHGLAVRGAANLIAGGGVSFRTKGGELVVGSTRGGRLQLRRAPAGWMTRAGEQAFFRALSATANIRLSAAAAGFSHSAFYQKRRVRPAFAREMRLAHAMGYDRVEMALLASALPESHADDAWRHNDPPPIPPMTPDQAIQLFALHRKSIRDGWDAPHRRKRRGEPWETYTERLRAMWVCEKAKEAEDRAVRRAAQWETEGDWTLPEDGEAGGGVPPLPALDQVTGWSKADPAKPPHNPDLALFGGWRLKDWQKRKKATGG